MEYSSLPKPRPAVLIHHLVGASHFFSVLCNYKSIALNGPFSEKIKRVIGYVGNRKLVLDEMV